jgi:serine/threonine-protein kinase RsbT
MPAETGNKRPPDIDRIAIDGEADIVMARQRGRSIADKLGFSRTDSTLIATAISELARNILVYARRGEISLQVVENGDRVGVVVIASDQGPGIPDIHLAMQDGWSTTRSLGLGLPGARRLMDEFDIQSKVGVGTTITMHKWRRRT